MHNLFLGSSKIIFELCNRNGIVRKETMEEIQRHLSLFSVPAGVGALPGRIRSNYGGFTAKQWNNWIILYTYSSTKSLVPRNHMRCW